MVKTVLIFFIFISFSSADVYENNCLKCHNTLPVSIDKYFYRYLLKYSSEKNVKKAMVEYLNNPTKENTIMPQAFIKRFGVKKKTKLTKKQLQEAIDRYWEEYKVFGKLK